MRVVDNAAAMDMRVRGLLLYKPCRVPSNCYSVFYTQDVSV